MSMWEYKIWDSGGYPLESELNEKGRQGWELIQFLPNGQTVFKREVSGVGYTRPTHNQGPERFRVD